MDNRRTRPVFLDCDPGVDDALALGYLVASPNVTLVGVGTVFGNCAADVGARNACDLLTVFGAAEVPVAIGAAHPSHGEFHGGVAFVHGDNGVGNVELPHSDTQPVETSAPELLLQLSHEYAGALELVAVGPLTNIAAALALDPTLPERIARFTIMGGTALHPGNVSPVAEANIIKDAEAAAAVFAAAWELTMVGLDVTMRNTFEEEHRQALLRSSSRSCQLLGQAADYYFDFHEQMVFGRHCSAMHDPLAAVIAADGIIPSLAPVVAVSVDATDGPGRGQTIADLRGQYRGYPAQEGAHCRVVLELADAVAPHFLDVIARLP